MDDSDYFDCDGPEYDADDRDPVLPDSLPYMPMDFGPGIPF